MSPFPIVSVQQMRSLEAAAMSAGTTEHELQERAGQAVAEELAARLTGHPARIDVLVGKGNNGRDAVVAARHLATQGHHLHLWLVPNHAVTPAEEEDLAASGISLAMLDPTTIHDETPSSIAASDAVLDGLLGIGAKGPMRPDLAAIVDLLDDDRRRYPGRQIVAVDVPSGVDADSGEVPGRAIRATLTVTFGAVKVGLLRFPAAEYVGELVPRSIGLPRENLKGFDATILDRRTARSYLPPRPLDAHKYRLGRVLVIAGSSRFLGAAVLSARAAARSGCGLVAVSSTAEVKAAVAGSLPEAVYPIGSIELDEDPEGASRRVLEILPTYQSMVIGPGLGRSDSVDRFVKLVLSGNSRTERPVPAVVDADALNALASWPTWYQEIGSNNVLTPHAGEMARLVGEDTQEGLDPWTIAQHYARRWNQMVVLKGPFTSIAAGDGTVRVSPRPNPALASAGTGDVLAGLCAGLIAQGAPPAEAASLATFLHAQIAWDIVHRDSRRSLLASDLLEKIPSAMHALACLGDL